MPAHKLASQMTTIEHMSSILRAEASGQDLQEGDDGIHVCAMRQDGSLYELGYVSETLVYQNPQAAQMAIDKIKFFATQRRKP